MNYTENKKKLDMIRDKYGCSGEVIFRTAIQCVVEYGQNTLKDETWYEDQLNFVDERHDSAEAVGRILFMTRDFEKAILNCAKEIAEVDAYDFLRYVQTEIYLGGDGIDYQRAVRLLKDCIDWITQSVTCADAVSDLYAIGFADDEIETLGYEYLLDVLEEEDE